MCVQQLRLNWSRTATDILVAIFPYLEATDFLALCSSTVSGLSY